MSAYQHHWRTGSGNRVWEEPPRKPHKYRTDRECTPRDENDEAAAHARAQNDEYNSLTGAP